MNSFYENIFSKYEQTPRYRFAQEDRPSPGIPPATQPPKVQTPVLPGDSTAPPARQIRIQQPSYPLSQTLSDVDIYTYPQNLRDALQLIEAALNREAEDKYTYDFLLKAAPPDDLATLNLFHNDELNHYKILRRIYTELTGQQAPKTSPLSMATKQRSSYCEALEIGLKEIEQELLEYSRIMYAMQSRSHINMMMGIIINEIRHASGVNFMYAKSCGK